MIIITRWITNFYHLSVKKELTFRAAALAYTTLLSVVPLILLSFTILSFFPVFKGVGEHVQAIIFENFVASSAAVILKYFNDFALYAHELSWPTVFFLLIIALLMMYNINRAFNAIWSAERQFRWSLSFLIYAGVLLLSPLLLAGVTIIGGFLVKMPVIAGIIKVPGIERPLFLGLTYVLTFAVFTIINWVLPSCKVKLLAAVYGGLLTTVLFELAKYAFTLYLSHFSTYRFLYGALAAIPIFLVWLYVSWTIILLGALVSRVIDRGM